MTQNMHASLSNSQKDHFPNVSVPSSVFLVLCLIPVYIISASTCVPLAHDISRYNCAHWQLHIDETFIIIVHHMLIYQYTCRYTRCTWSFSSTQTSCYMEVLHFDPITLYYVKKFKNFGSCARVLKGLYTALEVLPQLNVSTIHGLQRQRQPP